MSACTHLIIYLLSEIYVQSKSSKRHEQIFHFGFIKHFTFITIQNFHMRITCAFVNEISTMRP